MYWESQAICLRRQSRQDKWRADEVQAHGTSGPMVGWLPCLRFYGSDGWEPCGILPLAFAADAEGSYLNTAMIFFKRPLSSAELWGRMGVGSEHASDEAGGTMPHGH